MSNNCIYLVSLELSKNIPPPIKLAMLSENIEFIIVVVTPYTNKPEPTLALFSINLQEKI